MDHLRELGASLSTPKGEIGSGFALILAAVLTRDAMHLLTEFGAMITALTGAAIGCIGLYRQIKRMWK